MQQILSWDSLQVDPPEIFYWKPKNRAGEVDFVVSSEGRGVGIEVKSATEIKFKDTRNMRDFLKTHPEITKGIIVYAGEKVYPVASNIYAVPWFTF